MSISIFAWDSKPQEEGTFEELGVSASVAEGSMLLARSVAPALSLLMLLDFSTLYPSFSSSASLDDKPYNNM